MRAASPLELQPFPVFKKTCQLLFRSSSDPHNDLRNRPVTTLINLSQLHQRISAPLSNARKGFAPES